MESSYNSQKFKGDAVLQIQVPGWCHRRTRPLPAGLPHAMLPGRTPRSRRWSVLQHSRDARDRCADVRSEFPPAQRGCPKDRQRKRSFAQSPQH
jgi:hypothetical protein